MVTLSIEIGLKLSHAKPVHHVSKFLVMRCKSAGLKQLVKDKYSALDYKSTLFARHINLAKACANLDHEQRERDGVTL